MVTEKNINIKEQITFATLRNLAAFRAAAKPPTGDSSGVEGSVLAVAAIGCEGGGGGGGGGGAGSGGAGGAGGGATASGAFVGGNGGHGGGVPDTVEPAGNVA